MPVVKITNLKFGYNGSLVLDGIDFCLQPGEYVSVVGENGSGKSSLIKIILGINKPKSGTIELFGDDIKKFEDWHKIGYLPQGSGQKISDSPITVREVINLRYQRNSGIEKKQAINRVVELTDIENLLGNQLTDLSGGQRQRVFIARALVNKPSLLILDEPTSGIDNESRLNLFEFLKDISSKTNISIIHITHDLDGFEEIVDRTVCINKTILCAGKSNFEHIHK